MLRVAIAPFLAAIAFLAPVSASAQATEDVTIDELVDRLQPILLKTGQGARLNFDGTCPGDGLLVMMNFPRVRIRPVSSGATGIQAVRELFPEGTRIEQRGSVIVISLTSVPDAILQVPLSPMQLTRTEQYRRLARRAAASAGDAFQPDLRSGARHCRPHLWQHHPVRRVQARAALSHHFARRL